MARRKRKGIVLLNDHMLFAQEVLTTYERAELYDAIRAYSMEGVYPDLTCKRAEWRGIFRIMSGAQDEVIQRYEETCERNRARINKRWHNWELDTENTENTEDTGNTGNTGNTKQNKTKQNEKKQNNAFGGDDDLSDREVKGVPGVVWA